MVISANILFGAIITILIAVLAFFFRREREFGTIQATVKALHKRIDRIERNSNGNKKTMAE